MNLPVINKVNVGSNQYTALAGAKSTLKTTNHQLSYTVNFYFQNFHPNINSNVQINFLARNYSIAIEVSIYM
jgi:hypothetical protein